MPERIDETHSVDLTLACFIILYIFHTLNFIWLISCQHIIAANWDGVLTPGVVRRVIICNWNQNKLIFIKIGQPLGHASDVNFVNAGNMYYQNCDRLYWPLYKIIRCFYFDYRNYILITVLLYTRISNSIIIISISKWIYNIPTWYKWCMLPISATNLTWSMFSKYILGAYHCFICGTNS